MSEPNTPADFIFDNAPAHLKAHLVELLPNYIIKKLPPYCPMFNPIAEMHSRLKSSIKAILNRRRIEVSNRSIETILTPHRINILLKTVFEYFTSIKRADCSAYDMPNLNFV